MQRRAILGGTFNPPHVGHLAVATAALEQAALQQVIWVPAGQPPHRTIDSLPKLHHRLEMVRLTIAPYPTFSLSTVDCDRSPSYAVNTLLELQRHYPPSHWYWIIGLDAFQTLPRWYRRLELVPLCTWLVAPRIGSLLPSPLTQTDPAVQRRLSDSLEIVSTDPEYNVESRNPTEVSSKSVGSPSVFENSLHFCPSEGCHSTAETELLYSTFRHLCQQVVQQLASQQIQIGWELLYMPPLNVSSSLIRQQRGDRHPISTFVPAAVQAYIQQHHLYEPTP